MAEFYRAQLDRPDGPHRRGWLASQGVPVDGPWVVGFAPDRPTALVNELRRRGYSDVEIRASGLAASGRGSALVDPRFRDRVMVGIRDHRDPDAARRRFVGYAAPGAPPDVLPVLHGPATAVYRPVEVLFGLAEQPHAQGRAVVAATALEAIAVAAQGDQQQFVVAPCGPTLTGVTEQAWPRTARSGAGLRARAARMNAAAWAPVSPMVADWSWSTAGRSTASTGLVAATPLLIR